MFNYFYIINENSNLIQFVVSFISIVFNGNTNDILKLIMLNCFMF